MIMVMGVEGSHGVARQSCARWHRTERAAFRTSFALQGGAVRTERACDVPQYDVILSSDSWLYAVRLCVCVCEWIYLYEKSTILYASVCSYVPPTVATNLLAASYRELPSACVYRAFNLNNTSLSTCTA